MRVGTRKKIRVMNALSLGAYILVRLTQVTLCNGHRLYSRQRTEIVERW